MHSFSFISLTRLFVLICLILTPVWAQTNQTILILGDSLSAAYNIEIQSSWPQLLQKRYNTQGANNTIVNASISGETTFGGKNRMPSLLKQYKPDITIIELGGNDGLRGLNLTISQQNLATMIQQAQTAGSKVLLIGVRLPPNLGRRYNEKFQEMYQSIANQYTVNYLPKFLAGVAEHKALMQQDGIHPTAKAQPILEEKIFTALQAM